MKEIPGLHYSSPNRFSFRQRIGLVLIPPVMALSLKTLARLCRREVRGLDYWNQAVARHGRAVVAFWHETMGLAACHFRNTGFHTLTSYSYDGELAARVVRRFGLFALRGSSSRGGADALRNLADALEHVPAVGFTLDGPRGPRRIAKPGAAVLAVRTRAPVVPFAAVAHPAWRLRSWDRLPVPKPFGHIVCAFGPSLDPPDSESHDAVEDFRQSIERDLNALHDTLDKGLGLPE